MARLQKRIDRLGERLVRLWSRLIVIVHNDLIHLGKLATRKSGDLFKQAMSLARKSGEALPDIKQSVETLKERRAEFIPPPPMTPVQTISAANNERITKVPDDHCVYAIGDVHGRCDLLLELLDKIDADAADLPEGTLVTIIFLGDYIDRGMQSRQIIDLLLGDRLSAYQTVFLMGNHEEALLRFRDDASFGAQWAQYGGAETLFSYGLRPPHGRASGSASAWQTLWEQFRQSLPPAHLDFYQSLKHYIRLGDYFFVHAGLRPDVPLEEQTVEDMLWIRDDFLNSQASFPYLIVHGHTPAPGPFLDNRRMGLDTAAFSSGMLTAAKLFGTDIEVLTT